MSMKQLSGFQVGIWGDIMSKMEEKEVEVKLDGAPVKFVVRKLKYGERNECMKKVSKWRVNSLTGQPEPELDPYSYNEERLARSIVRGPVEWDKKTMAEKKTYVLELPEDVGDMLIRAIESMSKLEKNAIATEKK